MEGVRVALEERLGLCEALLHWLTLLLMVGVSVAERLPVMQAVALIDGLGGSVPVRLAVRLPDRLPEALAVWQPDRLCVGVLEAL